MGMHQIVDSGRSPGEVLDLFTLWIVSIHPNGIQEEALERLLPGPVTHLRQPPEAGLLDEMIEGNMNVSDYIVYFTGAMAGYVMNTRGNIHLMGAGRKYLEEALTPELREWFTGGWERAQAGVKPDNSDQ